MDEQKKPAPGKDHETPQAASAREDFIFGNEEKQRKINLKREELLQDQSIREGFRFLTKSILQFVFFVVLGAVLIIKSQDFQEANQFVGNILRVVGAILIFNGMLTFGGFRSR